MPLDLRRRHPRYEIRQRRSEFLWRSYLGGEDYAGGDYLAKYPRETNAVHEERKKRAYYLNYVAAVVDAYISEVFRRDPTRENVARSGDFLEDATGSGTPLSDFTRQAMTYALATEGAYAAVDLDEDGEPYAYLIHPDNMLDYAIGDDGSWLWALVAEEHVEDADPFVPRVEETLYRLWTRSEWVLYDKDGRQREDGRNATGIVPIVEATPGNTNLPVYDIATLCRRIYNLCSQIDEILINVTFPQMYIPTAIDSETTEEGQVLEIGTGRVLILPPEVSQAPGFIAPPDGPIKAHIEERDRLIAHVYSLAGLERRDPDDQQVQSGVAKAYDFRETNARLSAVAQAAERMEMELFAILAAYGKAGEVNVSYPKDFNVRAFREQLDEYMLITEAALPVEVKREAAKDLAGRIVEERDQEERESAQRAVEQMDEASFGSEPDVFTQLTRGGGLGAPRV